MVDELIPWIARGAFLLHVVIIGCLLLLGCVVLLSRNPDALGTVRRAAVGLAVIAVMVGAIAWATAVIFPGTVGLSVMLWGPLVGLIGGALLALAAGRLADRTDA